MQYVNLGRTGLRVSRLCLGAMTYGDPGWRAWVLPEEASRPFFKRALEAGINFFDTADMYSLGVSEEVTGRAVRDFAQRDRVVIATKVFNPMSDDVNDRGLSRKPARRHLEGVPPHQDIDQLRGSHESRGHSDTGSFGLRHRIPSQRE